MFKRYQAGDIVLFTCNDVKQGTNQHVALVVGERIDCPLNYQWKKEPVTLAHMQIPAGHQQGELCIEHTRISEDKRRGNGVCHKQKYALRFPGWNEAFIQRLCQNFTKAKQSNKFIIDQQVIEHQKPLYNAGILQKTERCSSAAKYTYNLASFCLEPTKKRLITCHELVVSIIHHTCDEMGVEIPWVLDIKPALAWANLLLKRASYSKKMQQATCQLFKDPTTLIRIETTATRKKQEEATRRKPLATTFTEKRIEPHEVKTDRRDRAVFGCLSAFFCKQTKHAKYKQGKRDEIDVVPAI